MKNWNLLTDKNKTKLLLTCILMALSAIISFAPIFFVEGYINNIVDISDNVRFALLLGACYLGMELLQVFFSAFSNYIHDKIQYKIGGNLQKRLFEKYLAIEYSELIQMDSSNTTNVLLEDINVIATKCLSPLTKLIQAIAQFIFGVLYLIKINWVLALITIPLGAITAMLNAYTEKIYIKNADNKKIISQNLWKSFSEIFRGIIPIRIYNRELYYKNKVNTQVDSYTNISNKQNKLEKINYFAASLLFMFTIGVIMIVTGFMVYKGQITIGAMVAVIMFNHMVTDPLITMLETRKISAELKVSEKRLASVLELKSCTKKQRTSIDEIKINNLTFSYETNGDSIVLDKINLHIKPKQHIAIMGETGSGKSTLCKLIAGLYDHFDGNINYFYNGTKVDAFPTISYMYQNSYIFDDTIKNNICLSNPNANDEEINDVIECCLLSQVVKVHGNEKLGENGEKLSGGEKARLRLAQCLLKNDSSLYIFDELSSSLDDETFVTIMQNIKQRLYENIVLFVEHNKLVRDYVDRVVLIEG